MLMIKIHNPQTGEVIEREMNSKELAQREIDEADAKKQRQAKAQAEAKKAALLAKLGLTEEEAKLLLS